MKTIINTVLLLTFATLTANAQSGAKGKFMTVYQKNGLDEATTSQGINFVKDGQAERYAWQPIDWQQLDYASLGETFDIKNVKSIFRYVESDNQFTVTLPEDATVDESEITVQAYGQEIEATEDNQYSTGASAVSVVNKDGKIIYDCYASIDTLDTQRSIELNALETAYTLLLPLFPNIFEPTSDEILAILKSLLAELPETHALATAIDQSIVNNGYLEMEDIEAEYQAAVDCIIEKTGLRNNYLSADNAVRRVQPSNKPYVINGNGVYGYKLVMNSSRWVENELARTWICNLTAYNSNRFAYTAWVRGWKGNDGLIYSNFFSNDIRDNPDNYDLLRKCILKPQRVSTFMGTFTDPFTNPFNRESWEGIANYFSDSYRLFFEEDFWFDDMTWDNTKKTFDMSFFSSNDVVIVLGPADNNLMMYYNILKSVMDPIIKEVAKKLTGAEDEDCMLNFCIDLVADEDYRSDFSEIINSNRTYGGKAKEILILTWPKFKQFLYDSFLEQVKENGPQFVWDHWGFMYAGDLQKALDVVDEASHWFKWLKLVEKVGDVSLGVLGLTEGSYYYDLSLDFNSIDLELSTGSFCLLAGESTTIDITGNGSYSIVSNTNPTAVKASIDGDKVIIKALTAGDADITIKDNYSGKTVTITVTVIAPQCSTTCPDANHPHMIDLGLPSGTKWSCCNVGASTPESYGGYFAWGETSGKSAYDWYSYQYSDSYANCEHIGDDIAGTEYDVATAAWGSSWKMPTREQYQELFDNTTSIWFTMNGVDGRLFTGSNGGFIFLPAAGNYANSDLNKDGEGGYYWSSSLKTGKERYAWGINFSETKQTTYDFGRYYGLSVPPVAK